MHLISFSTVSLREKTKYPKSAEGRRFRPSDPHPIGATTGKFFADRANAVGSFIMRSLGHLTTTPVYKLAGNDVTLCDGGKECRGSTGFLRGHWLERHFQRQCSALTENRVPRFRIQGKHTGGTTRSRQQDNGFAEN